MISIAEREASSVVRRVLMVVAIAGTLGAGCTHKPSGTPLSYESQRAKHAIPCHYGEQRPGGIVCKVRVRKQTLQTYQPTLK